MPQPPPPLPGPDAALFLDVDGTLAEIAPCPEAVHLAPDLPPLLGGLAAALDGALAVVSGRPVADLDRLLAPLHLPAAGVHGLERRGADGILHSLPVADLQSVARPLQRLCMEHPGLRLEAKPGALALHYRQAPQHAALCLQAMAAAARGVEGMGLLHGKMVVELKPLAASKGRALHAFLQEPPFARRQPWFFGDDVTDEEAFDTVQALGGIAVKLGPGETRARHRLEGPAALHRWLQAARRKLTEPGP